MRFRHAPTALLLALAALVAAPAMAAPGKAIDVNLMQVAIEALVIEVNENDTRDIGINHATFTPSDDPDGANSGNIIDSIDMRFPPATLMRDGRALGLGGTVSGISTGDNGRYVSGEIAAGLRALVQNGKAEVRTRPIAVTLHETKVSIETTDDIPFQDIEYADNGDPMLRVAFRKVGVKLTVTPRILTPLDQERVELDFEQIEVSGVANYITLHDVPRPLFVESSAKTKVILHNGESLVIGGMKGKREMILENRIPFIGRIPILGWLFKTQHREIRDTDILFFVTPYILAPGSNPILPFDFQHANDLDADLLEE